MATKQGMGINHYNQNFNKKWGIYMLIYKKKFASSFETVDIVVREIIEKLLEYEVLNINSLLFRISFMLRELLNNSVEHGNHFDETKSIVCEITYLENILEFIITDEGDGVVLPSHNSSEDALSERYRGISTIIKLGFELEFKASRVEVKYDLTRIL